MHKKTIFVLVFTVSLLLGINQLINSISNDYFLRGKISEGKKVDIAFECVSIFMNLGLISDNKIIAVAASYARNYDDNFISNMRRGGKSVRMLLSIARKKENSHAIQASYEALSILIRMPLDAELAQTVNDLAQKLTVAITSKAGTPSTMEKFQVTEVLAMFAARSRAEQALRVITELNPPQGVNDSKWLIKLALMRIGFSSCIQSDSDFPKNFQSDLYAEYSKEWIKNEARFGWDVPFMDVVIRTSKSPTCIESAGKFKSMIYN